MKKLLCALLASLLLVVPAFAEETEEKAESGKVEIEFCVGDATLLINGEEVTVEKPYVVGEGVTLVPVRVITEAFGATVGWVKETKTITLEYPDVNIVLQIGNPTAEINGRAETLLAAPELTENGFTMVPLRFISENFGAEVGYDNETKRITVVKESLEEGTTVEGAIENKFVGDSYFGWSMENPKDMYLDDRSFDGTRTYFNDDYSCRINIKISEIDEEYDFDDDFAERKNGFGSYTLSKADKDTSDENKKTMHFQAKSKTAFRDVHVIVTEKYIYVADGLFDLEECKNKDEHSRIIATFDTKFEGEDIYDLSNIKDGMRTYENEDMKFSIDIPETFVMTSYESAVNNFSFGSSDDEDYYSSIIVSIYSKDDVNSAESFAKQERERAVKYLNESIVKLGEIELKEYENFTGHEYSIDITAELFNACGRDVYFELGEYIYSVSCLVAYEDEAEKEYVERVISSFKAEELDFEEVGIILYPDEEREGTTNVDKMMGCSFDIPKSFTEYALEESAALYISTNGTFMAIADASQKYTSSVYKEFTEAYEFRASKTEGVEIVQPIKNKTIGGNTFKSVIYKQTEDKAVSYTEDYFIVEDGILYIFELNCSEITYSEYARNEMTDILKSLKFN